MKYIMLKNGVKMPIVGYGTAGLKGEEAYHCVLKAIEKGYTMIDTAHMYGNEKEVGDAIKDSGIDRQNLFIVSKVDSHSRSYELTKKQIDESLKKLKTQYIDLYLIHEPYEEGLEMWKAIVEAYDEGKLKAIGISNYFGRRYEEFICQCGIMPMINQLETHIYMQRIDEQKELESHSIALMSWSPLTGGRANIYNEPILLEIANNHNKTVAQVILNYFVSRNIIVIPKTRNENRMIENMNIFDFQLNEQEIKSIQSLNKDETLFDWTKEFI